jgi:hypothetical protein
MGLKLVMKYGLEEGDSKTRELSMGQDAAESNGRPRWFYAGSIYTSG